jgi:hypothetical protein
LTRSTANPRKGPRASQGYYKACFQAATLPISALPCSKQGHFNKTLTLRIACRESRWGMVGYTRFSWGYSRLMRGQDGNSCYLWPSNTYTMRPCSHCKDQPATRASYCKTCFNAYKRVRRIIQGQSKPVTCSKCGHSHQRELPAMTVSERRFYDRLIG